MELEERGRWQLKMAHTLSMFILFMNTTMAIEKK